MFDMKFSDEKFSVLRLFYKMRLRRNNWFRADPHQIFKLFRWKSFDWTDLKGSIWPEFSGLVLLWTEMKFQRIFFVSNSNYSNFFLA